jgi:hypothetical protein
MNITLSVKEIGQFQEDTQLMLDNLDVLQRDAPIAIMSLRMVQDVDLKVGQNVRVTLQPLDEERSQYRQPPLLFSKQERFLTNEWSSGSTRDRFSSQHP